MNNPEITDNRFNAKQWLLISLLLRLMVMPFTLHGDLLFVYGAPHFLSHGQWDAYRIASEMFDVAYYPPLTMIVFAGIQFVFRFLFPSCVTC